VTAPYYGISTGSLWSRLAQLNIDGHFLPGVLVGSRFSLSRPCLGSTIALRRNSLVAIGGFEALADCLADDYEIGALMAARGEEIAVCLAAGSLACRAVLIYAIERGYGLPPRTYWLIPLRDLLSFAVLAAGAFARDLSWKGHRYTLMSDNSTMISERRSPSS